MRFLLINKMVRDGWTSFQWMLVFVTYNIGFFITQNLTDVPSDYSFYEYVKLECQSHGKDKRPL